MTSDAPSASDRYGGSSPSRPNRFAYVDHLPRPDLLHRLHRGNVARLLERAAQRDRPFELAVVVQRLIGRLVRPALYETGSSMNTETGVKPRSIAAV